MGGVAHSERSGRTRRESRNPLQKRYIARAWKTLWLGQDLQLARLMERFECQSTHKINKKNATTRPC